MLKELRVLYMHKKYTILFSSNTNLVFIIVLKIAGFHINFFSIFKVIFRNFLCCFQKSCFENVIHSRKLHAYCYLPNYNGIPEFLDSGRKSWMLDSGRWTLDSGRWTRDAGLWTLDSGHWTLHLESQALCTKHSCRLVQNKIRTQFLVLLILQRVQF